MRRAGRPAALLFLGLVLSTAGCAAVPPWERGRLAKPQMSLDPDPPQRELREHVYRSREAASGASAARGGGCGCY